MAQAWGWAGRPIGAQSAWFLKGKLFCLDKGTLVYGKWFPPTQSYFCVWKTSFFYRTFFPNTTNSLAICALSPSQHTFVKEKAHKTEVWCFVRFLLHNHICEGNRGVMVNPIRWFGSVAAGRSAGAHGTRLSARTQAAPNARIVFVKGPSDAGPGNTTTLRR